MSTHYLIHLYYLLKLIPPRMNFALGLDTHLQSNDTCVSSLAMVVIIVVTVSTYHHRGKSDREMNPANLKTFLGKSFLRPFENRSSYVINLIYKTSRK